MYITAEAPIPSLKPELSQYIDMCVVVFLSFLEGYGLTGQNVYREEKSIVGSVAGGGNWFDGVGFKV